MCAKSIEPFQPAKSARADMGRNFYLLVNFVHAHGAVYVMI